jgi:uncharacterized repeat protein (TIGR03809 family)
MPAWITTQTFNNAALKWRVLAERRRAHLLELYQTGRWKLYFTEERFLMQMRDAVRLTDRWAELAPLPGDDIFAENAEPSAQRNAA